MDTSQKCLVVIDDRIPPPCRNKIRYTFSFLSKVWGFPVVVRQSPSTLAEPPDIFYGCADRPVPERTLRLEFDERSFQPEESATLVEKDGRKLWTCGGKGGSPGDCVGGVFRLLTMLDESGVSAKDRNSMGVFGCQALPAERRNSTAVPLVENNAAYLLENLTRIKPSLRFASSPKWPGGKKFAIAITHDGDAISLGAPLEIMFNLTKGLISRNREYLRNAISGLKHRGDCRTNPLWGFDGWRDYEQSRNIRSAFYLSPRNRTGRRHIHDSRSPVDLLGPEWDSLRKLADENWEIGLHAPIHAKDDVRNFVYLKQHIEEKIGQPIFGLRHHYWAMDWRRPFLTFRQHVNAGFRYDTSLAWRDRPGFRPGTCHPFNPYDPVRDKELDIYELPTCLMDGHLLEYANPATAVEDGRAVLKTVRDCGGVATLDWHTETAGTLPVYRDHVSTFRGVLEEYLEEAWVATPWQIVQHWHRRSKEISRESGNA